MPTNNTNGSPVPQAVADRMEGTVPARKTAYGRAWDLLREKGKKVKCTPTRVTEEGNIAASLPVIPADRRYETIRAVAFEGVKASLGSNPDADGVKVPANGSLTDTAAQEMIDIVFGR